MPVKDRRIGIYGIFFNNECIYIGKTNMFGRRVSQHKSDAKKRPDILKVDKFISENNINDFSFVLLEECKVEELSSKEESWIANKKPRFNILVNDRDMSQTFTESANIKRSITISKMLGNKKIIICKEFPNVEFDNKSEWTFFLKEKGIDINNGNINDALESVNNYTKGYHFYYKS